MGKKLKTTDKPEMTIFEHEKLVKKSATTALKIAKEQEQEKLRKGYHYVLLEDGKTMVLRSPNTKRKKK